MELGKTGINVARDIRWGTHFCHFYETGEDLLEVLVSYFKAGLENNEFCVWFVFDPLTEEDAKNALKRALPDADQRLAAGDIEILLQSQCYQADGAIDVKQVTDRQKQKLAQALAKGYAGMRLNVIEARLTNKQGKDFAEYEHELTHLISDQRMILLCTYPLAVSKAAEFLEVARAHHFAVVRGHGKWEVHETPDLKWTRDEVRTPSEQLVQRVREIEAANEELRSRVAEGKRAEKELRKQTEILQTIFDHVPAMISFAGPDGRLKMVNRLWESTLGWSLREIEARNLDVFAELYPDPVDLQRVRDYMVASNGEWGDFRTRRRDGRIIDTSWARVRLSDGVSIGIGRDITKEKRAEEEIRLRESQLAESQRLAHIGSWNWDIPSDTLTWSQETYRIFGLDPREFHPTHEAFLERVYPEDRDFVIQVLDTSLRTKAPVSYYVRIIRSDGALRTLHSRGLVVADEQGNPRRIYGTVQDVTERRLAEEQLKGSNEQLRALSARLASAREEEGTRIAREIHDQLGSALTTLRWDLEDLGRAGSESAATTHLAQLQERIAAMVLQADAAIHSIRSIASELRPSVLDDLGISAAIEWQAQQFEARTGIACHCDLAAEHFNLTRDRATALFRIMQEVLTNVLRHANATRVLVAVRAEAGECVLEMSDNGRGITEDERAGKLSLGLVGMRERTHLVGGTLEIAGVEGQGTTVVVRVGLSG